MNKKITSKKTIFIITFTTLILLICAYICLKFIPLFISLQEESNRIAFKKHINSLGTKGFTLFLLIQIIQIFIALIPGEIVELLAGILYGPWLGLFVCLLGNLVASFLIYSFVKLLANKNREKLQEKLSNYSFLNNNKKVTLYLFVLFLIPGLPKDIFTYLGPFLPISFFRFICITSIARIPSILSSTYSSNSILNDNYTSAIIILGIFALFTLSGFIFKDKIIKLLKNSDENSDTTSK